MYGQGLFIVDASGRVTQVVIFDYYDPRQYYARLVKSGEIHDELDKLETNMQYFLDQERVLVNGVRVYPRVVGTTIGFRGDLTRPYIVFHIEFDFPVRPGRNRYEDYYEPETTEYDYEICWVFPPGWRVLSARLAVSYQIIAERILTALVSRGTRVGPYECIEFEVPEEEFTSEE